MTVYSYKATDKSGKFIEGDIDAPDYHTAIEQIRQLNYFPVKVAENEKIRSILVDIRKRVHAGTSFADALAEHPNVFSKLYINMVRAGEAGGMVGEALSRLARFLEKSGNSKTISAPP